MTCEFPSRRKCERPATTQTAWGDFQFCHGHAIVAAANRASHGEFAISADEYRRQIEIAKQWFRESPNPPANDEKGER